MPATPAYTDDARVEIAAELAAIKGLINNHKAQATERCERLLPRLRQLRDTPSRLQLAAMYGQVKDHTGRNVLFEALQLAQSQNQFEAQAQILDQIARSYLSTGDFSLALQYWTQCIDICESIAPGGSTWVYGKIGMGQAYEALGNIRGAADQHREALSAVDALHDGYLSAKTRLNLGVCLIRMAAHDEARACLLDALDICLAHQLGDYAAESRLRLGELALLDGDLALAEALLLEAHQACEEVGYSWAEVAALGRLAEVRAKQSRHADALVLAQRGLAVARAHGYQQHLVQLHAAAAEQAQALGDVAHAYAHLQQHTAIQNRLQAENRTEQPVRSNPQAPRLLAELAAQADLSDLSLDDAQTLVLEQCLPIMGVQRSSLWVMNAAGTELRCRQVIAVSLSPPPADTVLQAHDLPELFAALRSKRPWVAHDCRHHPWTFELAQAQSGWPVAASMLNWPLLAGGQALAFLWIEHLGEQRNWTPDEVLRSRLLADLLLKVEANAARKALLAEVVSLNDALREANQDLERRVQERTAALQSSHDKLKLAMDQLVHAEKLAAMGRLTAGFAHELNTPLGVAISCASSLQARTQELQIKLSQGPIKRSEFDAFVFHSLSEAELIVRNSQRAARLVRDFKQVAADSGSDQRRRFNLNETTRALVTSLFPQLPRAGHILDLEIPSDIELDSYPGAFEQVLANLLENTLVHAFKPGMQGVINIRATSTNGSHVVFEHRDNGCGVPADIQHRVFDPFFTTRFGQGGSGLGLYIAYNLVHGRLGGSIALHSTPTDGTCWTLTLPLTAPAQ